jgi:hypothetical protein
MGYIVNGGRRGGPQPKYGNSPVPYTTPKQPEPDQIRVNLDPTNPVDTILGGVGGLFGGIIQGAGAVAGAVGSIPVLGDVLKGVGGAISTGLGAIGEVGFENGPKIKDIPTPLDIISLPGEAVMNLSAGVRMSEVFGKLPDDVKRMMASGKSDQEVRDYLVQNNRGFSDNFNANMGFALLSDPLNYVPFGAVAKGAKVASSLGKLERTAISKADDIFRAAAAGESVPAEFVSIASKRGELVEAMVGTMITPEDLKFLNKWRIAGTLYDATVSKVAPKFSALVGAMRGPVLIGMTRSLGDAPKNVIEGISGAGAKEAASNFAESLGRGLMQTTIFSMSRLFSRGSMNLGRERALRAIKTVDDMFRSGSSSEDIATRLLDEGLVGTKDGGAAFANEVRNLDDAGRRAKVNEIASEWSKSTVARAGAEASGDYKYLQEAGGIRISDTADEAAGHIAEGARRYESLDEAVLETLFVEKAVAAASGSGSTMVTRIIGGAKPVGADNLEDIMRQVWRANTEKLAKMTPQARKTEMARMVQLAEIAAYGRQGTNAAQVRAIFVAAKAKDTNKLTELTGVSVSAEKAERIAKLLESEVGQKLARINLVRANSLTDTRIAAIMDIAKSIDGAVPLSDEALMALPDDLRQMVLAAKTTDELAVAISGYFPDLHLLVGKTKTAIWEEMRQVLDNIVENGNTVTTASSDELKALVEVLDEIAPGAGDNLVEQMSRGSYTIGFAPKSGVITRPVTRVTDDAIDIVSEPSMPFVDSTADLADELSITTDTFARSSLRKAADRWLTPISSKVVEQQQIDNTIKIVAEHGGTEADARRLLSAIGEAALKQNRTPRALVSDEGLLRDIMQKALGSSYRQVVDAAGSGDPRRVLMKMYAGTREVVGSTQYLTGKFKVMVPQVALITDFIYPALKFKLNPLFYIQEAIESPFFNYLRGIQRQLTSGEYELAHGWARAVPFAKSRVGAKLGLSKLTGPTMDSSVASLVLGQGDSALRADLDVAEAVIFLQGRLGTQILSGENGQVITSSLRQMISGRAGKIINGIANPYPMKDAKKVEMALSIALDEVADKIRFEMPEQWVAMSKQFGTNNPRKVMIHLLQDSAAGWVNPVRVIDGARPRNFAFSGAGSLDAAKSVADEVNEIAAMTLDTPQAIGNAKARIIALKDVVRKSAETGNEVSRLMLEINKAFADDVNVVESIASLKRVSDDALRISSESIDDFKLVNEAVIANFEPGTFRGFSREKIAASLAKFRDYGLDMPGMEAVIADLRLGKKLSQDKVRALGYAMTQLLDLHGPEEALLSAMKQTVRDTSKVANRIHFYNPDRTALERSLNHPYLAFYPLSYMIGKVVPEFARAAFVKFPFTNRTAPFAGYEIVREIQDHIAVESEANPEFNKWFSDVSKSDTIFLLKQLFPGLPGDISASGPRWVNRTYAQMQRAGRPAIGNRPQATVDPGYAIRALADQAKSQSVWGTAEQFGGFVSEAWDFFLGPVDHNESNPQ